MNYYYDVLINLSSDTPIEFYEWMENDPIEHIRKIPIMRVNAKVMKDALSYKLKFNEELLENIYMKCESITNKEIKNQEYMFCLTDTKSGLVLELNGAGEVICLSKLLLNDEINLIEISNAFRERKLEYEKLDKRIKKDSLRIEAEIKTFLNCEIKTLFEQENNEKLKYIYYEWTGKLEENVEHIYNKLKELIASKFDVKEQYIYDLIKLSYNKESRLSS